jgi:hypothetical protein
VEFGELVRQAKDYVLKHGSHPTVLVASGEQGRQYIYLPDFPNRSEEKILYLFGAGKQTAQFGSVGALSRVFLVMEAWQGKNSNIRPSQDPNRIEVLVISCLDLATKEQSVVCLEYIRDAKGILREIKDMVLPDGQTVAKAESPLLPAFVAGYTHR